MNTDLPSKKVKFYKEVSIWEFRRNSQISARTESYEDETEEEWTVEDEEQAGLNVYRDGEDTVRTLMRK